MVKLGVPLLAVLAIWFFSFSSATSIDTQTAGDLHSKVTNNTISLAVARNACPHSCLQPKKTGVCFMKMTRWFFNKETMNCEEFTYGGCRGNSNRFKSRKACLSKCSRCQNHNLSELIKSDHPRCDCDYIRLFGGCRIVEAPPIGYKCQCNHHLLPGWRCDGEAIKCDSLETCPAKCTSLICCLRGAGKSGNCKGYPSYNASVSTIVPKKDEQDD